MTGKLCEEHGEYLCSYCSYANILGYCTIGLYKEVYYTDNLSVRRMWEDLL